MTVWFYTLISVSIVSLISLIGVFALSLGRENLNKALSLLVAFAVGGLFGDAFIHLLPETFRQLGSDLVVSLYVISGLLIFFILEKFIRWRHCHVLDCEKHSRPVGTINFIGDGLHNFFDGILIAASYMVNIPLGIATTLAVVFHEIPQEIGHFGIFLHAGFSIRKALLFNFLSALTAIAGAFVSLLIGPHISGYALILLPITAGGFIYIAGSDLIPELHQETKFSTSLKQFIAIILGIGIMALLVLLE